MPRGKKRNNGAREYPAGGVSPAKAIALGVVFAILVLVLVFIIYKHVSYDPADVPPAESGGLIDPDVQGTPEPTPSPTPEPTPEPTPVPFEPHAVDSTQPGNYVSYTNINVDGTTLADGEDYADDTGIYFGDGEDYSSLPGVITFRGNNYRDNRRLRHGEHDAAEIRRILDALHWLHRRAGRRVLVGQRLDGSAAHSRVAQGDARGHEYVRLGEGGPTPSWRLYTPPWTATSTSSSSRAGARRATRSTWALPTRARARSTLGAIPCSMWAAATTAPRARAGSSS